MKHHYDSHVGFSERQVLEQLKDELRVAAEECDQIAVHPFRGFIYDSMRQRLRRIETLCIQVGRYRDGDCRWFPIADLMAECHKRAGGWLRASHSRDERTKDVPLFRKLAENMRALRKMIVDLETRPTGHLGGRILPAVPKAPRRQNMPIGWRRSRGGLLLPPALV